MSKDKQVAEQTTEAPVEEKNETAVVIKVADFLKSKGKDGATANEVAVHLEYITQAQLDEPKENKEVIQKAGKKARTYLRKAVDTNKGLREVRDGRHKIYQIF